MLGYVAVIRLTHFFPSIHVCLSRRAAVASECECPGCACLPNHLSGGARAPEALSCWPRVLLGRPPFHMACLLHLHCYYRYQVS